MKLFIKAAEIWLPDRSGHFLTLGSAEYGDLKEFAAASAEMAFTIGEGLPGQTWAAKHPLLWTDLNNDHFQRSELAESAGIACGLSIPIFAGEFLLGVAVLFFGKNNGLAGAVEIWHQSDTSPIELKLLDGYYGDLERFEWVSRRLTLLKGRGLPGAAWDIGRPIIIGDLAKSNTFLRSRNAAECGITTGMAIPFSYGDKVEVVALLSARGTPVAQQFEVWVPDGRHQNLIFDAGFSSSGEDLSSQYQTQNVAKGDGVLGDAWQGGRPLLATVDGRRQLVLPLIKHGMLVAMVRLVF